MKLISYAPCALTEEVIISSKQFSCMGTYSLEKAQQTAKELFQLGKKVFFDWDILMTQRDLERLKKILCRIDMSYIHAIRVRDKGALQFLLEEEFPQKIHLNLDGGDHNERGILRWIDFAGEKLERVILSKELDKKCLMTYIPKISRLSRETELLGLGPIALFYTPRALLSAQIEQRVKGYDTLQAVGFSEESVHRGFPIVENSHGTFMFYPKDLNLLDQRNFFQNLGLSAFRIDLRHLEPSDQNKILYALMKNEQNLAYPRSHIKGFFNANKSHTLFKKLKNFHLLNKGEQFVGEICDIKKNQYMGFFCQGPSKVRIHDYLEITTPDGKNKKIKVCWLKDALGRDVQETEKGRLFYSNPTTGISIKSSVALSSQEKGQNSK